MKTTNASIRNIAIIAHVDNQSGIFVFQRGAVDRLSSPAGFERRRRRQKTIVCPTGTTY
ncbi:MAG TPA: hypothetical protein VLY24_24195 [Bryobacteraceae bacterium]|nr:hypothetical protein [Bryobacteraceae bacterium]